MGLQPNLVPLFKLMIVLLIVLIIIDIMMRRS